MARPSGAPTAKLALGITTDSWTEPFWAAAAEHRLVCARCTDCGTYRMPPGPFCPTCSSQATAYEELSGRGTLYSFTVIRHAVTEDVAGDVPYVVAVVSLDGAGDARLFSNVVDCDPESLAIGQALQVAWDDVGDGITVPRFTPA